MQQYKTEQNSLKMYHTYCEVCLNGGKSALLVRYNHKPIAVIEGPQELTIAVSSQGL